MSLGRASVGVPHTGIRVARLLQHALAFFGLTHRPMILGDGIGAPEPDRIAAVLSVPGALASIHRWAVLVDFPGVLVVDFGCVDIALGESRCSGVG